MAQRLCFRSLLPPVLAVIAGLSCTDDPCNCTSPTATLRYVRGKLVNADGVAIAGAVVRIYPAAHVPTLSSSKDRFHSPATTDAQGEFGIANVGAGTYNIEAENDSLGAFIDSVEVGDDSNDIEVPTDTLKPLGSIRGVSHLIGQNDTGQVRITYYIPGTQHILKPSIGGAFSFDGIAAGRYQIIGAPDLDEFKVLIVDTTVVAGDMTDLDTLFPERIDSDGIIYTDTAGTLSVKPDDLWSASGVNVEAGHMLTIRASGTVTSPNYGDFDPDGGTGISGTSFVLVNQAPFALYARIGAGPAFKVGKSYYGFATATGELSFVINTQHMATGGQVSVEETGEYTIDSLLVKTL